MHILNFFCVQHFFIYRRSLLQVLQIFKFSFFQEKRVNHSESYLNFQNFQFQFQFNFKKISFITFIIVAFYEISIKFKRFFNPLKIT